MTTITVEMREGKIKINIEGHADYDVHGKDIVCAAVSAITQTSILGLQQIAEQYPENVEIKFV